MEFIELGCFEKLLEYGSNLSEFTEVSQLITCETHTEFL